MPQQKQMCYDESRLQEFIDENVDETLEADVLAHIGTCKKCQSAMEKLAARQEVWSDIKNNLDEDRLNSVGCETQDLVVEDLSRDLTFIKNILAPTDDPAKIGRLGSYEVCGIIGRGSAGIVVKALDTRLHRFVAIKILAPVYSSNGSARRRFEREGRSIASVQDDHIIPVYTVEEYQGNPYIVMQYVPDGSLLQRIEKMGPLESEEVVCVAMQIAKGLAAAHARGIVHRDVKPANVLLAGGVDRAMVTDFGLARVVDEATMTRSGAISGTPQFMSPEQAKGESLDQRSDLFSLGSVMYAACTGRSPFRSETVFGVIKRVCESEPRPIREINPKIDEWLEQFIQKLHAKHPDDRFESSAQVADLLFKELTHMQSPTLAERPLRPWAPTKPKPQRNFRKLGLIAASFAAIGLLIGGWQMGIGNSIANGTGWFGLSGFVQEPQEEELPQFENTTEATIDVKEGGNLILRTNLGQLNVKTHDKPTVQMNMTHTVAAKDQEAAAKIFRALEMNYEHDHEDVAELKLKKKRDAVIIAKFVERNLTDREIEDTDDLETLKEKLLLANSDAYRNAEFELLVPESFNLDLHTAAGEINVSSIDGRVKLRSDGGQIAAKNIEGEADIMTSGGHIEVGDIEADATIKTNGGHVEIGDVDGNLLVRTAGGHIEVGEVEGTSDIRTNGGHIIVERNENILTAETTGGRITIHRAEEACNLNASGGEIKVLFVEQPSGDSTLTSASGNIKVGLSRETAFQIDSTSGNGKIIGPFVEGKPQTFKMTVNDGEHSLLTKTGNGNIEFFYLEDSVDGRLHHPFPENESDRNLFDVAFQFHKDGELEKALEAYEEAIEMNVNASVSTYNIGCVWAEKGEADKAFESLNEAITLGFRDLDQFEFDEDLKPLRDDSRFRGLISRIKGFDKVDDLTRQAHRHLGSEEFEEAVTSFQAVLDIEPENENATFHLGYALHLSGDTTAALPLHLKAASGSYAALGNYNAACVYSLKGKSNEAFKYLDKAIEAGFIDIQHMEHDSDLDNIREDERFQKIIDKVKERVSTDFAEGDCDDDCCDEKDENENENEDEDGEDLKSIA